MLTVTTKRPKVIKLHDWDDARYSHVPPKAALDERLNTSHLRVLILIGRVNTQHGWCECSQIDVAKMLGLGRAAVNEAISGLVKWGYLQRRSQQQTRTSLCHYRVNIDGEGVSSGDDTTPSGVSPTDDTGVAPQATGVSPTDDTSKKEDQRSVRSARKRATTELNISLEGAEKAEADSLTPSDAALAEGLGIAAGHDRAELLEAFRGFNDDKIVRDIDKAFVGFCKSRGPKQAGSKNRLLYDDNRFKSSVPAEVLAKDARRRADKAARGEVETVTHRHPMWVHWLDHIRSRGERELANEIEIAGGMVAPLLMKRDGPLPKPLKTSATKGRAVMAAVLEAAE